MIVLFSSLVTISIIQNIYRFLLISNETFFDSILMIVVFSQIPEKGSKTNVSSTSSFEKVKGVRKKNNGNNLIEHSGVYSYHHDDCRCREGDFFCNRGGMYGVAAVKLKSIPNVKRNLISTAISHQSLLLLRIHFSHDTKKFSFLRISFFGFGFLPIVGSQWNLFKEMPTLSFKSVDRYLLKLFTIVHYKEIP